MSLTIWDCTEAVDFVLLMKMVQDAVLASLSLSLNRTEVRSCELSVNCCRSSDR